MSRPTKVPLSTSAHPVSTALPPTPEIVSTYLAPVDGFPSALAELELVALLVLHPTSTRQLDREYRTDPAGAHPVTLDRAQELVAEPDTRQTFLAPTDPIPRVEPRVAASWAYRGAATAGRPAATPPPMPATGDRPDATRTGQSTATTPPQTGNHGEDPSHARTKALNDETRREVETTIRDLGRLRPGEQIDVWHRGQRQCTSTVDQTAPSLAVVWIREAPDGYRRLVHTRDTELRRSIAPLPTGTGTGFRPGAPSAILSASDQQEETS